MDEQPCDSGKRAVCSNWRNNTSMRCYLLRETMVAEGSGMVTTGSSCRWMLMLMFMLCLPCAQAQTSAGDTPPGQYAGESSSSGQAAAEESGKRKVSGLTVFWIVLVISLLFVVGSASLLKGMGGKQPAARKHHQSGEDGGREQKGDDR